MADPGEIGADASGARGRRGPGAVPARWWRALAPAVLLAVVAGVGVTVTLVEGDQGPDEVRLPDRGSADGGGSEGDQGAAETPAAPTTGDGDTVTAATGARTRAAWEIELPAPASALAFVDDLVVAASHTRVLGLERETGQVRWRWRADGDRPVAGLHRVGDHVVVVTPDDGLVALAADTGEIAWSDAAPVSTAHPVEGTLVVAGPERVRALAAGDGTVRWERSLSRAELPTGQAEATLVVTHADGVLGLEPHSGEVAWRRSRPSSVGRVAQRDGVAAARDGEVLWLLEAATGEVRARVDVRAAVGERIRGTPQVVDGDTVALGVADGIVAVGSDGAVRWHHRSRVRLDLFSDDAGVVLTVAEGVGVRAFDPDSGRRLGGVTPSGWFTSAALDEGELALAVHSPTQGRIALRELDLQARR